MYKILLFFITLCFRSLIAEQDEIIVGSSLTNSITLQVSKDYITDRFLRDNFPDVFEIDIDNGWLNIKRIDEQMT